MRSVAALGALAGADPPSGPSLCSICSPTAPNGACRSRTSAQRAARLLWCCCDNPPSSARNRRVIESTASWPIHCSRSDSHENADPRRPGRRIHPLRRRGLRAGPRRSCAAPGRRDRGAAGLGRGPRRRRRRDRPRHQGGRRHRRLARALAPHQGETPGHRQDGDRQVPHRPRAHHAGARGRLARAPGGHAAARRRGLDVVIPQGRARPCAEAPAVGADQRDPQR